MEWGSLITEREKQRDVEKSNGQKLRERESENKKQKT